MTFKQLFLILFLGLSTPSFAQLVTINKIQLKGNKQTKDFVIFREMLLHVDSVYAKTNDGHFNDLLALSKNRIYNLNLFNKVVFALAEDTVINDITNYTLEITVLEKWYIWPIPLLEFSDRNINVWSGFNFDPDRTNYGIANYNYNLFGRNHTLKTNLKTGYNKEFSLEYRIPFISKTSNWGMTAFAKYTSQNEVWLHTTNDSLRFFKNGNKNLIQSTEARVEISKRIRPLIKTFAVLNIYKGEIDLAVPDSGFYLNNSHTQLNYGLDLKAEIDTRYNIYFPLTGYFYQPIITLQQWKNTSTQTNLKIQFKVQHFKRLSPKLYSALSGYTHLNSAQNIPYFSRKMFGYDEIIRGYERYVMDGSFGWKLNASIRYHLIDKSDLQLKFFPGVNYKVLPINLYIEGYVDGGRVSYDYPHPSNQLINTFLCSAGLGLNALIYNDRVLRLEYSVNNLQEDGFFVHFKKAI